MSIKIRKSKKLNASCYSCGNGKENSLDMFDVKIGNSIYTLCDTCVEELFNCSLRAICYVNGRLKYPKDISIINARKQRKWKKEK